MSAPPITDMEFGRSDGLFKILITHCAQSSNGREFPAAVRATLFAVGAAGPFRLPHGRARPVAGTYHHHAVGTTLHIGIRKRPESACFCRGPVMGVDETYVKLLLAVATLLVVAAAPAFARDYNKSAAGSRTTTVSQPGTSHSGTEYVRVTHVS